MKKINLYFIVGLVIGILLGVIFQTMFITTSLIVLTNNILPKLEIQNINFDLNETALMEAVNNKFIQEIKKEVEK